MNAEHAFLRVAVPFERSYTLARKISAIQVMPGDGSETSPLGLITQLPEGAEVDVGGPGFNDRTIKVVCGGFSYFVFLDDLEPLKKPASVAVAG